jgi:hypothetical protein
MLMRTDTSSVSGPARRRGRWPHVTGSGLGLLAGVAFVLTPACSGGGGVHESVHLTAASSHVHPACGGGGATGDD